MDDIMSIRATRGTKVKYLAKNGYDYDVVNANGFLKEGEVYTVDYVDVGGSMSHVHLIEFPHKGFNTVMFAKVDEVNMDEDMIIHNDHIQLSYNFGCPSESKGKEKPIFIELLYLDTDLDDIAISIEDAQFLVDNLQKYINALTE